MPYPYTEQDGKDYISDMISANEDDIFAFAITADNKVVGSIGVFRQGNIHRQTAELGYYVAEEYWSRGIMIEAVSRFVNMLLAKALRIRHFESFILREFSNIKWT